MGIGKAYPNFKVFYEDKENENMKVVSAKGAAAGNM